MRKFSAALLLLCCAVAASAQAYSAKPKLVVLLVADQLRGDLLDRHHDEFGPDGFRRFLDRGAWFSSCYYQYANTKTAPGHSTIGTGTYSLGHGILANDWWNPELRKMVTSVEDAGEKIIGVDDPGPGASPRNLLTDTFADELRMATQGKARVYSVSLKDRAAILPVGYSANGAFWLDKKSGQWESSTYYFAELPDYIAAMNAAHAGDKYLNREWKNAAGDVLRSTAQPPAGADKPADFYDLVGGTPFANDYQIELAEAIIEHEKLGQNAVSDMLSVSFSATDILGHKVGPDSPEQHQMLLDLDRQLAGFFAYLDEKVGKDQYVVAFTADHGVAPMPATAAALHLPSFNGDPESYVTQLNAMLAKKYMKPAKYVLSFDYPLVNLDDQAFAAVRVDEATAEKTVGELLMKLGMRGYATKTQLAAGQVSNQVFSRQLLNAYSPEGGWYVQGVMPPFVVGYASGDGHALPYSYDAHAPLGFFGPGIRVGEYRNMVEPVDIAVTLASLLHVNKPASAVGRVLVEAIADQNPLPQAQPAR